MMEDLSSTRVEMEWKFSQYVVFDHRAHQYSDGEVSERLKTHIGRQLKYTQIYVPFINLLMGSLTREEQRYYLGNGMHKIDLTKQLTEATDITGKSALYTLLEIDRTDMHLQARREHRMREIRDANRVYSKPTK